MHNPGNLVNQDSLQIKIGNQASLVSLLQVNGSLVNHNQRNLDNLQTLTPTVNQVSLDSQRT